VHGQAVKPGAGHTPGRLLPGWRLDGLPEHPARQILAHRHWHLARPAFLAAAGTLTDREAQLLERWPRA
jgi:hypothetical protein